MEIRINDSASPYSEEILRLMRQADEEFIPPLSDRDDTVGKASLSSENGNKEVRSYFQACRDQYFLFALSDSDFMGFLTFKHDYTPTKLEQFSPANYPTTLIIDQSWRQSGVATALYRNLLYEIPENLQLPNIISRTWSENQASIRLHEHFNFDRVDRIPNHRAPGIDTIYFRKNLELR